MVRRSAVAAHMRAWPTADGGQHGSTLGGTSYTIGYQYDAAGRRTRMDYPGSFYVTYSWDTDDNLSSIRSILINLESGTHTLFGVNPRTWTAPLS